MRRKQFIDYVSNCHARCDRGTIWHVVVFKATIVIPDHLQPPGLRTIIMSPEELTGGMSDAIEIVNAAMTDFQKATHRAVSRNVECCLCFVGYQSCVLDGGNKKGGECRGC